MRRIAQATVAAIASVVMTPWVANAEPMVLTATQMESITAAGPPLGININVALGDVLVQTNITTQVANAISVAKASCGICTGAAPVAFSFGAAINANVSGQFQR